MQGVGRVGYLRQSDAFGQPNLQLREVQRAGHSHDLQDAVTEAGRQPRAGVLQRRVAGLVLLNGSTGAQKFAKLKLRRRSCLYR